MMAKVELTNMVMIMDRESNMVLVQERAKSPEGITFPGGHVEPGESIVDSAVREVKEETGLDVKNLKYCGIIHWCNTDTDERYLAFLYKTNDYSGIISQNIREGKVFWIGMDKLESMDLSENFQECLPVFLVENYSEGFGQWESSQQNAMIYK